MKTPQSSGSPAQKSPALPAADTHSINARTAALELTKAVLHRGRTLDEAMAETSLPFKETAKKPKPYAGFTTLTNERDRHLAHMIAATVLRRLGQIDAAISACLDVAGEVRRPVQDLLRLGAAQILFMRIPSHAAVDTTVTIAATSNATIPYKGMINAVLRRLVREGEAIVAGQDAARLNTPDWLWLAWRKAYGTAIARKIAETIIDEAATDITIASGGEHPAWAEKLEATLLPTGSLRLSPEHAAVTTLDGFAEGAWWVQDAAAAIPATLFGERIKGQSVADLCAAPGGKTMQLAAMGGLVTAVDRSMPRLKRLEDNLRRAGLVAKVIVADAGSYQPPAPFPFVLLDAPCTATGTLRRHPDAERIKTPEDVTRLAALQSRLLDHAVTNILADGGTLVYSVCSLQPEEAEEQIAALLTRHSNLRRIPVTTLRSDLPPELINKDGDLRCLPCHWSDVGGMDGFYAAVVEKV